MKLLVLAGGFGTRLQSVVAEVPKALAPVGKVPFLQLQIDHWKTQGINSFIFLLHHQADLVISFLQKEKKSGVLTGCEVFWLVEPMPMDTGGAVAHAVEQLQLTGNFLVTNAERVEGAARSGACNAVLIKPNQAGTITETLAALAAGKKAGFGTIVSARSGETEDTTIVHLAVGWDAGQLKVGSFARSERMAKWNEALRVEDALRGDSRHAGAALGRRL